VRQTQAEALVAAAREGDPRSLARLISLVEDGSAAPGFAASGSAGEALAEQALAGQGRAGQRRGGQRRAEQGLGGQRRAEQGFEPLRAALRAAAPHAGQARVLGLTGSPGVGKSTVTDQLVRAYRASGQRVAVLAVDPTSPFSGGALLGDRVRMADHATDPGVFIRSMASRGHLGGLSWAAPQAVRILDAAGFDVICVETVGVGQAEVEIAGLADSTIVVMAPGLGDSIQTAKAGILEIADVFVVNKSDRPGAHEVVRDLRTMLAMATDRRGWKPPIVSAVATTGEGIEELTRRLDAHWAYLGESGLRLERLVKRAREEISAIAVAEIRRRLGALPGEGRLDELAAAVARGKLDPYSAADELISG
jgi:LAO/AO transport system kinase